MDNVKLAYTYVVEPVAKDAEIEWQPDALGPGVHAVIYLTENGAEKTSEIQFGADYYTKEKAQQWLGLRGITIEESTSD